MHKYLVTGGAGFIGSHLIETLLTQGNEVYAIDDLSTGSLENISHLNPNPRFHFIRADIRDSIVMDRLCSEVEVVVHLAAAVGVMLIVEHPVHTIETNVGGTEAVLKAALRYNCRVLIASTSEVYGKGYHIPFNEEDDVLLGATSKSRWAYAGSKMVDEFLSLAYHREYNLDVILVRLFNTVGPRQSGQYGMVIPRFIRQALAGLPITIYGNGEQCRCFCDVRDVVEALISLAVHPEASGQVFNIGNTQEISIRDLAEQIKMVTKSTSPLIYEDYEHVYAPGFEDMERRVPDISRISSLIGWKPTRTLNEILCDVRDFEMAQKRIGQEKVFNEA